MKLFLVNNAFKIMIFAAAFDLTYLFYYHFGSDLFMLDERLVEHSEQIVLISRLLGMAAGILFWLALAAMMALIYSIYEQRVGGGAERTNDR